MNSAEETLRFRCRRYRLGPTLRMLGAQLVVTPTREGRVNLTASLAVPDSVGADPSVLVGASCGCWDTPPETFMALDDASFGQLIVRLLDGAVAHEVRENLTLDGQFVEVPFHEPEKGKEPIDRPDNWDEVQRRATETKNGVVR